MVGLCHSSCFNSTAAFLLKGNQRHVDHRSLQLHCHPFVLQSTPRRSFSLHFYSPIFSIAARRRRSVQFRCFHPDGSVDITSTPEVLEKRVETKEVINSHEVFRQPHGIEGLSDQNTEEEEKGLLQQMWDIVTFAGPALGIWLSGPIMSMIDTAVVGNSSLVELAALGPGTVFCDQVGYLFMFLSVATSNLIATSMVKEDKGEAANHLSHLLFVGLVCGIFMLVSTMTFSPRLLKSFIGKRNEALLPAACSYVQIRALAWPAVLVGLVAQSASLGMQDAWAPLQVLTIASILNFLGDILLCTVFKYGIAGAAWATTISQWVGGYLMLRSLGLKGFNPFAFVSPSVEELSFIFKLSAPVILTISSKVCFFSFATYMSTALGAVTLAAHQVMGGIFSLFCISAEPLNQTAQAFMPGIIQGPGRDVRKAQTLLRSLLLIGAVSGVFLGALGTCFALLFPHLFTQDASVIMQMRAVTLQFLWGLMITPPLLALEGTLLAGRDLKYLSLSMIVCVLLASSLLMVCKKMAWGLEAIWWTLSSFQTIRFCMALSRLTSRNSVVRDSRPDVPTLKNLKPA